MAIHYENAMTAKIIEINDQRQRRRYVAPAQTSDEWQQIKASSSIEDIMLDDSNAEIIGRMIAGEMTLRQAQILVLRRLTNGIPMQ